jgi:hypothetical protein
MSLYLGLSIVTIGLLISGFLYAWTIYRSPIDRTWLEVVIGTGFTIIGAMGYQGLIYSYYGCLPWWSIFFIPAAFTLTGLPQIGFQEWKFRSQKQKGERLENEHNGRGL